VSGGEFSAPARAAIYEAGGGRCIGCGSAQVTAQHRHARGMGGTSNVEVSKAVNGIPLCGSGTTGCHGWAELHPLMAELLGWRLMNGRTSYLEPWWSRDGWHRWWLDADGVPLVKYVDPHELDRPVERGLAIAALQEDVARRAVT
jgi:hypothetical protein